MKKFTKIIAGVTATILALGIAGCSKDTDYPDFINTNLDGFQQEETTEKYVINVTSEGGLKLDGVIVDAYNQNGQRVKRGMSSNGRIDLGVALGEYTLRVDPDSLPAGYSVNTAETYVTNPEKRDEVNIKLPSSLLPSNSSVNTFRVGQVMKDITFTDCDGVKYKISDLLKTKKAVVLNFWYVNCTWCRQEFPALERAYESARNNIEVLAVCSTIYGDSNASIKTFKQENGLQMPMGLDDIGLCTAFGVSGYPTTAIIDRYGLIAMVHDSAELNSAVWSSTFNKYASDDYVQEVNATGGGQSSAGREKPDVVMPISSEIEAAVNGAGCNATYRAETDDEYSWPWLIKDDGKGKYIYSSNKGKGNSYAIITADIEMEANQVLSYDYMVSSEAGRDLLYVLV
ncbi:MAG: TlpA family protein disulfide reductase, partial [Clostridia bacterium]|nr:TlpA family protein disulfide reductase [Clostridia bacterium]